MIEFKKGKLTVKAFETRAVMGKKAACDASKIICNLLESKSSINCIFAAAPSQNDFIENLLLHDEVDFSKINAFHMDEYVGLDKSAPQGFGNFLRDRLLSKKTFKSVNYIDGQNANHDEECERYSALLSKNPPDIIFCGVGENGHVAFNDPSVADFHDNKAVKVVELDDICRMQQVNDGCFSSIDMVPKFAITLTMPTLLKAKYHICVVPAATKAKAVREMLNSEISEKCPATILRNAENATLYLDSDSATLI